MLTMCICLWLQFSPFIMAMFSTVASVAKHKSSQAGSMNVIMLQRLAQSPDLNPGAHLWDMGVQEIQQHAFVAKTSAAIL